ncbi:hypothetical protein BaRGS_00032034 [Batillaria attramentaria]|uniref:RING-type E3 ubiquitin transferase n=1 Tax=Batillaria attramentaria TaxID=370345 RepID=A0ABD0JPG5_9CAEN
MTSCNNGIECSTGVSVFIQEPRVPKAASETMDIICIRTNQELGAFWRAILPAFLVVYNDNSGLLEGLYSEGALTDTDYESLVSGKHLESPKDTARKLFCILSRLPLRAFNVSVAPQLCADCKEIIPERFFVRADQHDLLTAATADFDQKETCLRHDVLDGHVGLETIADVLYQLYCLPPDKYKEICTRKRNDADRWEIIFDAFTKQHPCFTEQLLNETRAILERYHITVPGNFADIMTAGFPCTCEQSIIPPSAKSTSDQEVPRLDEETNPQSSDSSDTNVDASSYSPNSTRRTSTDSETSMSDIDMDGALESATTDQPKARQLPGSLKQQNVTETSPHTTAEHLLEGSADSRSQTAIPIPEVKTKSSTRYERRIRSEEELARFWREILPAFLDVVDPDVCGFPEELYARGVLTDTDYESLYEKRKAHVHRKQKARYLWFILSKHTLDIFLEKVKFVFTQVAPNLCASFGHIIPEEFFADTRSVEQMTKQTKEKANERCLRHCIEARVRYKSVADVLCHLGCLSLKDYEDIIGDSGKKVDNKWNAIFDAFRERCPHTRQRLYENMRELLERYNVPIPDKMEDIMSRGFPCTGTCPMVLSSLSPVLTTVDVKQRILEWLRKRNSDKSVSSVDDNATDLHTSIYSSCSTPRPISEYSSSGHSSTDCESESTQTETSLPLDGPSECQELEPKHLQELLNTSDQRLSYHEASWSAVRKDVMKMLTFARGNDWPTLLAMNDVPVVVNDDAGLRRVVKKRKDASDGLLLDRDSVSEEYSV